MKNTFFEKTPLLQKGSAPKDSDMMSFYDDEAYFDNLRDMIARKSSVSG